jgi:hypothetical protein
MSSNSGNLDGIKFTVDGREVAAIAELDLLDTVIDRKFSFAPHAAATAKSARQRSSVIARLSNHLPPGGYLCSLAMGLAVGKVTHALAAVTTPRLTGETPNPASSKSTQVALNDVARSITGGKRRDLVSTETLLRRARMTSLNRMAAAAAGVKAWKAYHSADGEDGGRNPPGRALFDQAAGREMRSATAGEIRVHKTLLNTAAIIWNGSPDL